MLKKLRSAVQFVLSLVYPISKAKLHRLVHVAGTVLALAFVAVTWLAENVSVGAKLVADLVVLAAYFTRWRVAVGKVDAVIDSLPIPEGDVPLEALITAGPARTIDDEDLRKLIRDERGRGG